MKTYQGWNGSGQDLSKYLQVGDEVDEELVDYILCVMPPATHRSDLIQMGEPHSFVAGRETFTTVHCVNGTWRYAGHCHRGSNVEPGAAGASR
jgi:hypothetical protein